MTEPLHVPRISYISAGPYIASMEWHLNSHILAAAYPDLTTALWMWFHPSAPFGSVGSPDRRIVVDARGHTIIGFLEDRLAEVSHVITSEVAEKLREMGLDGEGGLHVLDLELEMLYAEDDR